MITVVEQIKCIERELKRRAKVYPGHVAVKFMSQEQAVHEIAVMEAVLDTLRNIPLMALPDFLRDPEETEDA